MADAQIPSTPITALSLHETLKLRSMEAIVKKSHCFDGAFVFGGYVRDYMINHVLPNDVDLSFKSTDDITTFLRILSELYQVDQVEKHAGYGWGTRRFETWKARIGAHGCDGMIARFTLDLVSGSREAMATAFCDFTCNLLCMSRTGIELVSVPESMHFHASPIQEVFSIISAREFAVVRGTVSLLQSEVGPYAAKLCRRAHNMVARGWTMTPNGKTFSACVRAVGATTEAECAICKSDFEDKEVVIQTLCNHTFHSSCISTWLLEGRSTITCPVCREVHFMLPASAITIIPPKAEQADGDDEDDEDDEDYDPEEDLAVVTVEVERTRRR
jgi:hypothetical protein